MNLLITNDDGIYSPGLHALAEAAREFGTVHVVAPDVEQSSMGHAVTHVRPLRMRRTRIGDLEGLRVNGTPADCVTLGCHMHEGIDVVLSGVNLGPNIGNAMWHSGTLAAAKQGALLGLRGIAVSTLHAGDEPDFERLRPHIRDTLALLLPLSHLSLLNVNLPDEPSGVAWTRQSVRHYDGRVVPGHDPMGREHFWVTVRPIEEVEEGTDRWAMQHGLITITPLRLDLTDHGALEDAG
ncbi:MAG TPA: 5'/3'-nucleotidase SurE [Longimicrobiales bacterium]|nr:5'/3'-nucleotidase SurE [Longimicrobiales bacterium]